MVFVCVNIFWFGLTHEQSFTLFFIIVVAVVFYLASLLLLLPLLLPDGPGREVSQLCLFTFHRCEGRQSYSWRGQGVTNLNTQSHYSYLKDWGTFSLSPFVSTNNPMLFSYPVLFCCHDWGPLNATSHTTSSIAVTREPWTICTKLTTPSSGLLGWPTFCCLVFGILFHIWKTFLADLLTLGDLSLTLWLGQSQGYCFTSEFSSICLRDVCWMIAGPWRQVLWVV